MSLLTAPTAARLLPRATLLAGSGILTKLVVVGLLVGEKALVQVMDALPANRGFLEWRTRVRTGDTMIFSHIPRPLDMRIHRISKRICVHGVP